MTHAKDGRAASCPFFRWRECWHGCSAIACSRDPCQPPMATPATCQEPGENRLSFRSREERDTHYGAHCCGDYEQCERYTMIGHHRA